MVQRIASKGVELMNSHKLDLSNRWPIPRLGLRDLIGSFRFQFHVVEDSLDADDILLNIASGPHNPVLRSETEKVSNQNRKLRDG